jgi:hypothetical protein
MRGWKVVEGTSKKQRVSIRKAADGSGLLRCHVWLLHIPSERVVHCVHAIGATEEEREISLRIATVNAVPGRASHRGGWDKQRRHNKRTYRFSIVLGTPIDEDEAFESISRQLEDEIFSSITVGMEVSA